ncbi:MAG: acyl-CoA dehydrogenase family protein [Arenicellales bacterium]|jgi:acyl-CoA dehydrogenase|nr:acyl-CoA dehydrogenase family protein [Arenicellales bacterium]|tara:strand:+ start:578 stop:1732 length:1155 start_codon:yes stop_codon:yes gene_type:complete
MPDKSYLDWPFFDNQHRALAESVELWAAAHVDQIIEAGNGLDDTCINLVRALGDAGICRHAVAQGDVLFDVRSLCVIRETLARFSGLADFAFAMQGLGSGPISLFGTEMQKRQFLPGAASGQTLPAFALSEPEAGSDVASITTTARTDGTDYLIDGCKTWISNGGIADHYVVFARTGEESGTRGLSAFIVPVDSPGLSITERIETIAPHPLATLEFDSVRVPTELRVGAPGEGFKVAMATLDIFRSTVGAAALGLARRALSEAVRFVGERKIGDRVLASYQMTQARIADMATGVDAAALLVYRAAWTKDSGAPRISREASMAKLFATEEAQRVIDSAVQLHGGQGVRTGRKVEELYRDIRAMRVYEGASEIQKLIIARQTLGAP